MTSIGDVIALTGAAYKLIEYFSDVRQAPEEWRAVANEVVNSRNILEGLQQRLSSRGFLGQDVQQLTRPLSAKEGPLSVLESTLKRIQAALEVPENRKKELLKAFKWPFKSSEVRGLLLRIQRAKADIVLALAQADIYLETEILQDTKALMLNASQAEFDNVLQAISPHDFFAYQQSLRRKVLPGTVRWFLDGPSFQGWAETRAPVLFWCHGIPGAGKTVLASTAFEELKSKHAQRNVAVLIAFCLFDHGEAQNATNIISTYLKEAVPFRGEVSNQVQSLYGNNRARPPLEVETICTVLASELGNFERVFFILDGLDEIVDRSEMTLLLEKLQAMLPCPKLLVTSRQLPDLTSWFYEYATEGLYRIEYSQHSVELPGHLHEGCVGSTNMSNKSGGQIFQGDNTNDKWKLSNSYRCCSCNKLICVYCYDAHDACLGCRMPRASYRWTHPSEVNVASHHDDIERAVDERINRSGDLTKNIKRAQAKGVDLRTAIMERVRADSQNTFLLVGHQMDVLADQVSPLDVMSALKTLPTEMDEVYERIFARLNSLRRGVLVTEIRNLIAVVASARRPLTLVALQHAMSITAGDTDVNSLKIPDMRSLISRAFGLIVIDGKMNHVRLAHETAADYIRHRAVDMPNGDRLLADACMAYLQLNPVCDPDSEYDHLEQTKKAYPFLRYATSFWASHIRLDQDRFLDCVLCLLRNDSAVKTMTRLMWQYDADWDCAHNVHGLHLAAYFGLTSAVSKIVRSSKDVDVLDGQATTPLMYAAMKGEKDTIAVLLEAGADPSRTCDRGRTALHRACQYNRVEVVQLLLQCSKDVAFSAIDEQFGKKKALAWAIHTGSDAILQSLLRNGYVDETRIWQDRDNNNPLILAAATGRTELIETLLADRRIPIDTTDDNGDTALTAAARQGHVPVVDLLLQNGADLEARNNEGATVLLSSIPAAPDEVTRLLVERGADVNACNNEQRGALFFCAVCNRPNLMRFFLELGQNLDVNVQGVRGATPLYVAVEHDYVECVEVLLEYGTRTDVRARNGLTPVSLAREGFHQNTLPLLETARSRERQEDLQLTARVIRTRTDLWDGEVSLHAAVVQMDVSQLTAYLDERSQQGFDIDALDCICLQTALHITARRDLGPKARLLLDRGARTDIFDQFGFQALHAAVFHDSLAVTEELIQRGADINSSKPGDPYIPPLHIHIDRQNPAIAFCLVINGAIIDANDETTTWLVGAAAQLGEFEVVRKALEAGVPFNERGEDGQTPYQRAKKHGHVQVAKYLFEQAQKDDREKKVSRGSSTASRLIMGEVNSNKKHASEMLIAEEGDTQAGAEDPSGRQTVGSCLGKEGAPAQVAGVSKSDTSRIKWRRWILVTLIWYRSGNRGLGISLKHHSNDQIKTQHAKCKIPHHHNFTLTRLELEQNKVQKN